MDEHLLPTQRALRHRLFEGAAALDGCGARELTAQMLLYLDEPERCWALATEWLRRTLDADRADGGFGGFLVAQDLTGRGTSYRVAAEARRGDLPLPSVLGVAFDATDPGLSGVWAQPAGFAFVPEVDQERGFSQPLRLALHSLGTRSKLALALRDGGQPVGLMCADWAQPHPRLSARRCLQVAGLAQRALGPVLAAVERLARQRLASPAPGANAASVRLTPAERRVAELAATGMSYKEVARQLGRSVATVDHQLRQVRRKLGLRSSAALAHHLVAARTS